ncbi:SMP-30/gluconolactonase/LRE family protein [Xinfangfangia sp. D13-10-4-6]|uniref:SMP-30/gluconolactonase/LRE family protein n=1 Tax=Pseudogemmobacter hezensis TaxID=2737662 RepID=UPI00155321C7|nr:SMP-30/gluconolactonase/LRE family protein [Pseudogemmobacter hezensis]NPD16388.1 SMP-30/gluconolactonase/LRE family protein [Pseudogemmobacter hezensis]
MTPFDTRICELGEGALWHPARQQYFWFDILNRRLLSPGKDWRFKRMVSAAGWVDADHLLISAEDGLFVLDLDSGAETRISDTGADRPETRSNDGRADRQGGFWFSTMGKRAEPGAGAIYRYYLGEVRPLFQGITIPNAISFAPDGQLAYFADTAAGLVWAQPLDADGWPKGERRIFLDLNAEGLNPDGATIDSEGGLWIAKWGAGAVMRYTPAGQRSHVVNVGGLHASCPAFGGADLCEMLVTTAQEGIEAPDPHQGLPWLVSPGFTGLPEPRVILG